MTTEESNLKARLFALYLGSQVCMHEPDYNQSSEPETLQVVQLVGCGDTNMQESDFHSPNLDAYILLKPLSSISDEDAIEVAKHDFGFFRECNGFELKVIRELSKISVAAITEDGKNCLAKIEISNEWALNLSSTDYLRSKSYALPFMGISVEDQVAEGWIKLKSE